MKVTAQTVALSLCLLATAGCASTQRLASYGAVQMVGDATVKTEDGHTLIITVHRRDNTLLTTPTAGDSFVGGMLSQATFGASRGFRPDPRVVDRTLAAFVAPTGCTVAPSHQIGGQGITFEAHFVCPDGVDLRALMLEQREALKRGEPIRLQ